MQPSGQFSAPTCLYARIPRVLCSRHGVRQVSVLWDEARARFTKLFERITIDSLKPCNISNAEPLLRFSWDAMREIQNRTVQKGLARKPWKELPLIGVDEKAFNKDHQYRTLLCDLSEGNIKSVGKS